jgi:hypothetical protein
MQQNLRHMDEKNLGTKGCKNSNKQVLGENRRLAEK